jgi:hypothetical protein
MTVVSFRRRSGPDHRSWQDSELQRLTSACAIYLPDGQASGWDFGETECGDPQLYLIGPAPEHDCILSISRIGRHYILEDGKGRVIFEHDNLATLAEQAAAALRHKKQAILAQLALAWCAMRGFYEEKVEPALAEPMEVLSHIAPQLAALA